MTTALVPPTSDLLDPGSLFLTNRRDPPLSPDARAAARDLASDPLYADSAEVTTEATPTVDLVWAVNEYYTSLYRFGFSLAGNVNDAADLTQETYRVLLTKGGEICDPGKVKSWLFTTLYRLFLRRRRRLVRFPETSYEATEWELPTTDPSHGERLDGTFVVAALQRLDEKFRTPLAMFYLQDLSYKEMAGVLGLPIGTIMSRLFRGKELLRRELQSPLRIAV